MEETITLFFVAAVVAAIYALPIMLVATVARNKGRDPVLWAILALVITPIVALALAAMLPPTNGSGTGRRPPGAPA